MNIKPTLKKYKPVQKKIKNSIFFKNDRILNFYVRFDKISNKKRFTLECFLFLLKHLILRS